MPKIKDPLWKRLHRMSEDIQIGGDVNFRSMSLLAVMSENTVPKLTHEQIADMERLLSRANNLIRDLIEFWDRHPKLENAVDRKKLANS